MRCVRQTLNEVAHAAAIDQPAEALRLLVSGGESLVVVEHLLECFALVRLQLGRRAQA